MGRIGTYLAMTGASAAAVLGLAACGGSSSTPSRTGSGGTITILSGTAPQSADSQADLSSQGTQLISVVNTPLLVFRRAPGDAGSELRPGLARSMPEVSDGGRTYVLRLRAGLHYSDGTPIRAGDFKYAVKRAIRMNWTGKSFLTGSVRGAEAFDAGRAKDISGITTDDRTGRITIRLNAPFGAIADVLALPGTAPVPQDTPMKPQNSTGVIGDGPYKWGRISVGQSYRLVRNPKFDVPGLPRGHVDTIDYKVASNVLANAQQVLQSKADVFDPGDTLPPSILSQVRSQASDRYRAVPTNSTDYFFMAVDRPPFSSLQARRAVLAALDLRALSRLDSGYLQPDCHLIPPGITGHSDPSRCPFHLPDGAPDLARARQLVARSGMKGADVTVWGASRSPRRQYVEYLTDTLNKIGFHADLKSVDDQAYFQTIGNQRTRPQIGWASWVQDFPSPWDFMQLNLSSSIQPQNSTNFGRIRDRHYDGVVDRLARLPANKTASVAGRWAALDDYAVQKGYYAAFGHEKVPKFYSDRIDFTKGVYSVVYQTDLTSLRLK
jgi:peptide/nickel transport system substrate-binding protein